MSILVSEKILETIKKELSKSTESFLLISAFCKLPLVEYFDSCIEKKDIEKKLIVRYRLSDILSGASDLELYPYCKENGWKLYFRLDLHAKTYVFDHLRCIVGSANATQSGMSTHNVGNYEIATTCELASDDILKLENLLKGSIQMNDEIYDVMSNVIGSSINHHSANNDEWPIEIENLFVKDYSVLFAEDFPLIADPIKASYDDLIFLNAKEGDTLDDIREAFSKSKCYLWLCNFVKSQELREVYFGKLSAELHNCLLNEPEPYRREVKQLLSNLLNWVNVLDMENIRIDRPNYSQRVKYIE